MHCAFGDAKQVFDDWSQQFVPLVGVGQLLWQSLSVWHWVTHIVPPPELLFAPLELLSLPPEEPLLL